MKLPRILIAAASSGSGKTMITCGILQMLTDSGRKVSSFKCGPDYIDPMFHSRVLGTRSRNLDPFFCEGDLLKDAFVRSAVHSDISVVEGVMGYYDGIRIDGTEKSSCEVSLRLGIPTILLVNADGSSVSSLAVLKGFLDYDRNMIKGVIFNRMSASTFNGLKDKVEAMGVKAIGYVPKMPELAVESRHLGLVLPDEVSELHGRMKALAARMSETVDIDLLMELADSAEDISYEPVPAERIADVRVGVAYDDAFCFLYDDNLDLLQEMGAEIVRFSPLNDDRLPEVDALILPGGYPELHGERLGSNVSMMKDIRDRLADGMPCHAECGGFMYLHDRMQDSEGVMRDMCGVIHGEVRNAGKLMRFGYASFSPKDGSMTVRGHEFHYWDSTDTGEDWEAVKNSGRSYECIHDDGHMVAGFPHLYYRSDIRFAERLIKDAARYRSMHR